MSTQTANPPAAAADDQRPLSGFRVLDFTTIMSGPFCTRLLADMGAEIIKIENPAEGGDVSRKVGPHFLGGNDSHFFQAFNRNKRSVTLDLRQPDGQAVLRDLVAGADAVDRKSTRLNSSH